MENKNKPSCSILCFELTTFLSVPICWSSWSADFQVVRFFELLIIWILYFIVKKESIRTMLAVVTYLRTQNLPKKGRSQSTLWDNNFWLDLDYLEVASAAQRCSAYFTALLYTEIWADIQK